MEKVACYIRVSTDEQRLHGISLDAQRDKLTEYAEKHNLKIVEWYEDEGVSGRKLIKNRPELQRMLNDAQRRKFDRILFIKLDRFFRSVAEYHECMKLIDPVLWTATEEKYDLTTANGRAFVNMKLTIAELEADQTAERIKIVNDYKVKTGQAVTGSQNQGYGFTVKNIDGIKKVVRDPETEHIVRDYIEYFLVHQNKRKSHTYIKNKYHVNVTYNMVSKLLKDTKLYGSYKGNDNYCESYIDKSTFDKIQEILKGNNIKETPTKRVYMFSGLVICPNCGRKLAGKFTGGDIVNKKPSGKVYKYKREYYSYRCNKAYRDTLCKFKCNVNGDKIEKALLDNLSQCVSAYITKVSVSNNVLDIDSRLINEEIKCVQIEMKNTTTAFRKNRMTEKEYDKEYEELDERLKELEAQLSPQLERDLTLYEELLETDWKGLYNTLDKEHKRAFWHKFIKEIHLNLDGTFKDVIFF